MKHTKRLASVLLALVMAMALMVPALAAETGSITLQDADNVPVAGKTFNAYKLLDVKAYTEGTEGQAGTVVYTVPAELKSFYMNRYNLTGNEGDFDAKVVEKIAAEPDMFAFAAAALAAAKTAYTVNANVVPTGTATAEANATSVTINNLPLGYYVVEDTGTKTPVSALMLDTTNPNPSIVIKADQPSIDKVILDADSDKDETPQDDNTDGNGTAQDVGSVVEFKLTSKVPDMIGYTTYTYIISDTMSNGLTPVDKDEDQTIDVKVTIDGVIYNDFTVKQIDQSFTITFTNFINQKNNAGKDIVITYSAIINENALTTDKETNTVNLEYSNNPNDSNSKGKTPDKTVYVYDFDIVIDKYTGDETTGDRLADAKFVLYKQDTNGNYLYYYYNKDIDKVEWNELNEGEELEDVFAENYNGGTKITEVATDNNGSAKFQGLDSGTYYLHETEAPSGYNLLEDDVTVTITATYGADGQITSSSATSTTNGQYQQPQKVLNNAGAELPSTGGMGTTIFYVVGAILVLGAVVLLVTKKRMGDEK